MSNFNIIDAGNGKIIKAWHKGVKCDDNTVEQLKKSAQLPFIYKWLASMPDAHWGNGSAVGTVVPTLGAVVPAMVGVDLGCGMIAVSLGITRNQLGVNLKYLRECIEKAVPNGRSDNGGPRDIGAWGEIPDHITNIWMKDFASGYDMIINVHPGARARNTFNQLGTLGTGNHFIELAEDTAGGVWIVLHSGSRGLGNKIGSYFISKAKELCKKWFITLPDPELAYLPQGIPEFSDYLDAVQFAQRFAFANRQIMLDAVIKTVQDVVGQPLTLGQTINCHHNYIAWENHYGKNVLVTRKGAVRAQDGDRGIIPGSMGARTYIVAGLGNPESFCSCSHGAGRAMGRNEATRSFTVEQHAAATMGVECDKTKDTLDETPAAYKDIEAVMAAQSDLVTPMFALKQFLCVKGKS
jgi:tRNA-splicing ligase RtcB (3'-phosphate/5'-hydroxy nucleic acid ligase)